MRRGLLLFGKWPNTLIMDLFDFCDQTVQLEPLKALEAEGLYDVLEFCFDLRCLGEKKDEIASTSKRTLFNNLKTVYQSLGETLQHVVVDMEKKHQVGTLLRTSELKRSTGTH